MSHEFLDAVYFWKKKKSIGSFDRDCFESVEHFW